MQDLAIVVQRRKAMDDRITVQMGLLEKQAGGIEPATEDDDRQQGQQVGGIGVTGLA